MQEREKEQETRVSPAPADPKSEPLLPVPLVQVDETDDDPDTIFIKAVAEIDTQPLLQKKKIVVISFLDVLQVLFCSCLILGSLAGIIWQAITYPQTLAILYTVEKPASLTVMLDVPTRTLAPVTLTREATTPTTGHGHQDAKAATGAVTFYNGQNTPQSIPVGTVLTGQDGVKITTDQPALVPAANLPNVGRVTILARAIQVGSKGNIAPYDINFALTSVLTVKNQTSFTNGQDARDFRAVAQTDVDSVTAQVTHMLSSSFQTALALRSGEQAQPTNCHTTTTGDHGIGEEAKTVTVKAVQTCSAVAYSKDTLVYVLSRDDEQYLAQHIQGDTPAQARTYLLQMGVISQASIPNTLPPAMYINFLVLVGK